MNTDRVSVAQTATRANKKPRRTFVPPGYVSRLSAFMDVVRFGPAFLPGATFLALLFHVERSLPYGKAADTASLSQMTGGVRRSDHSWVRAGSGLSKSTTSEANAVLEGKGLLKRKTRESSRGGHQPTEYTVNWKGLKAFFANVCKGSDIPLVRSPDKPLSAQRTTPLSAQRTHRVRKSSSQSKDSQSLGVSVESETAAPVPEPEEADSKSQNADDESPKNKTPKEGDVFAHPEDELRAIYREKTGDEISRDVERRIWEAAEIAGVSRTQFMDELRRHVPHTWRNPPGFLTNFARKIRAVAKPEPPVSRPAEPPKDQNGRCSSCKGTGCTRWDAGSLEYCSCGLGRDLKRTDERRAAKEAAAAVEHKPPGQADSGLAAMSAAAGGILK